jgi:hypothetical protein
MAAVVWPLREGFVAVPALAGVVVYAAALFAISPAGSLERALFAQLQSRIAARIAKGQGAQ